jgi:hypothetical protein
MSKLPQGIVLLLFCNSYIDRARAKNQQQTGGPATGQTNTVECTEGTSNRERTKTQHQETKTKTKQTSWRYFTEGLLRSLSRSSANTEPNNSKSSSNQNLTQNHCRQCESTWRKQARSTGISTALQTVGNTHLQNRGRAGALTGGGQHAWLHTGFVLHLG